MEINLRRKLAIGTSALAATAFAGGAYAATQNSGANDHQAFLNDVAKRLNVTPGELTTALKGAFGDELAAAVKAGKLTQAQADQIKQRVQQSGEVPFGGRFFGADRGGEGRFFGPAGPGDPNGGPRGPLRGALDAVSKYLGLTPTQLRDQFVGGKSLAQLAAAKHKSVSGLKDAITSSVRSRLDQALSAKMITSAQEQRILSRLSSHLDALINNGRPGGHGFFAHPGRTGAAAPVAPDAPPGAPPGAPPAGPPPPAY